MVIDIGVDIGGTFTDVMALNWNTNDIKWAKVPTTPPTYIEGIIEGIKLLDITSEKQIRLVVHGTTLPINALVQRDYPKTALITTKGFRDSLEIRRCRRKYLYNIRWDKPRSLVPRRLRIGVEERINYKGEILTPLNEDEVRETVKKLREENVVSYAVATLFSFINPIHEQRIREIILEEHPNAYVSISSEVAPIIREYERTSTTVMNAALLPIVDKYILDFEKGLDSLGFSKSPLLCLVNSNGGRVSAETARIRPVELLEGGHAAGVVYASCIGEYMKIKNILTYDGGGTTATQGLTENYELVYTPSLGLEFDIIAATPSLDIRSMGQGGGAIAWIDPGGALNVGPKSAQAVPGPACYGLGGTEPTITDALVLMGVLDPKYDHIRKKPWNRKAAEQAVKKVADYFRWDILQAAYGIFRIGSENVSSFFRESVVEKGRDPRDFVLFAYGGSGPLFASQIARNQEISKVVIPSILGSASALGCVLLDAKYDYATSHFTKISEIDYNKVLEIMNIMKKKSDQDLLRDRISKEPKREYFVDLRYIGEHWETTVPLKLDDGTLTKLSVDESIQNFHLKHEKLYGFKDETAPIELLTIRLRITVETPKTLGNKIEKCTDVSKAKIGSRGVLFDIERGIENTEVFDYSKIGSGAVLKGPAIIQREDGTIPIFPNDTCKIDDYGNCIIEVGGEVE